MGGSKIVSPHEPQDEADIATEPPPPPRDDPGDRSRSLSDAAAADKPASEPVEPVEPVEGVEPAERASAPEPPSGERIGPYEFIRRLGRGGMGVVYLARDLRLGRRVAVKLMKKPRRDLVQRFVSEARTTARCNHENIVTIYEVGEHEGAPYMVLEYLEGQTLDGWLQAHRLSSEQPVVPLRAVQLMLPVVRALAYAHEQGIVHRDLKPANIMLTAAGTTKVLDFGIAKVLSEAKKPSAVGDQGWDPGVTNSSMSGTLPYMSPEQLRSERIDHRSDLWAVGIMLYEMVRGQHPWPNTSLQAIIQVADLSQPLLLGDPEDLGSLGPIIEDCLKKRVNARISSATALLERLEALLSPASVPSNVANPNPNPYTGLAPFQEADAARFFGRERDVARALAQLEQRRMLAVVGPSGTGKSSFVRAGVIPALKASGMRWEGFIVRPGGEPLGALTRLVSEFSGVNDRLERTARLRDEPGHLGAQLRQYSREHQTRIVLFVDQFEELYTLGADRETRVAFVRSLSGVADDAASPLRVVLTMRSDFLGRVNEDRTFSSELTEGLMLLPSLGRDELRQALTRPLESTGFRFEHERLVDTALDALATTKSPLPILQFAAARLWEVRDRPHQWIGEQQYTEMGGIAGALAGHADAVIQGLSRSDRQLARLVFTHLVTEDRTRRIMDMSELRGLVSDQQQDALEHVIQGLSKTRLLLIEVDEAGRTTVELSHESLIESWPRLQRWLSEDQEEAEFRTRLARAARQWDERGRNEALLWRGPLVDEAQRWLTRWRSPDVDPTTPSLGNLDGAFLNAVVDRATRTRRRRRQVVTVAFVALIVVATGVSGLAVQAKRSETQARRAEALADERARFAEDQVVKARNATRMAVARESEADPTLVLALVREINPAHPPSRWRELARWARHQGVAEVVLEHPESAYFAAFSPDGARIVTTSFDRKVRIWSADGTGDPLVLQGHRDRVISAAFSPDGTRIVTASLDKTARIWNADGTGDSIVLQGHQDRVMSAAFSPDGTRIVTASLDQTARIWNADGTGHPIVLQGHLDSVYSASFSPDGTRIVTASLDKTARIWNTNDLGDFIVLKGHPGRIYFAAFSPDGSRVVTASEDRTARIWSADGSGDPIVLRGHLDTVYSTAFSPDGSRIATASLDTTVRIWSADGAGDPIVLKGHRGRIKSVSFSPDGTRILTASDDKTARTWNVGNTERPIVLNGHRDSIRSAAFSPDGTRIVTASVDQTARVWNADGTGDPIVLQGHRGNVYSAAFSPDASRIVTASDDKTARIWNADGTGHPIVLQGHLGSVSSAAFSPDGTRIVTASGDNTARIWNADGTGEPVVLKGHRTHVISAAFSPDGTRIVTASGDMTARVWNADGMNPPLIFTGHQGIIYSAVFSPDSRHIVTASSDKTTRIWRVDGHGQPIILPHEAGVSIGAPGGQGAFHPDGTQIVTLSDDLSMRLWSVNHPHQEPIAIRFADLDDASAAFSPDGTRIVTASHTIRIPATASQPERVTHAAKVWRTPQRIRNLDDPMLWTATTYCPSVEKRMKLLSLPRDVARKEYERCQAKVAAVRATPGP